MRALGHEAREYDCPGDPHGPVSKALSDGCEIVVACGGDGTVNGVASALLSSRSTLGILPLGTLNHFARDVGISGIAEAERILLEGTVRCVDVGLLNGRPFLNNSGIGIYPAIVIERERVRQRGIPKWPAFVLACFKSLTNLPFLRLHLQADGHSLVRITPFLFVGNNVYQTEGRAIGTRKKLDAGVLGICTARHPGPWGLIRIAIRAVTGHLREDRDFACIAAFSFSVRTRRMSELNVSIDGELVRVKPPLEYSVAPRALRVLGP